MKKNVEKNTLLEEFLDNKMPLIKSNERVVGFYLENPNPSIIGMECIYKDTINKYDSKIIYLDGRDGIINLFEIFKVSVDNKLTLKRHFDKLEIMYRLLVRNVRDTEVDMFLELMKLMYVKQGILTKEGEINDEIFEKKVTFPTISSVIEYITTIVKIKEEYDKLSNNKKNKFDKESFIAENNFSKDDFKIAFEILQKLSDLKRMLKVRYTLQYVKKGYGLVLDGQTSIISSTDSKNVYYELSCMNDMQDNVYFIAAYNTIYFELHNCITNSNRTDYLLFMELKKTLYLNNKEILTQFIEFEKTIASSNTYLIFLMEDIKSYMPNHAFSIIMQKVKEMIVCADYKIIAKQDESVKTTLQKVFGDYYSNEEIDEHFIENEKVYLSKYMKASKSLDEMF